MPVSRLALALAAFAATVAACRTAQPRSLVRVDAPAAEPGAPADTQALRVSRAVRSVADEERLACLEGAGAVLLSCAPQDVGSRTVQVRLSLRHVGTGFEVIADAPFSSPGDPALCRLATRVVRAVDAELGVPSARVHPGSGCEPAPGPGAAR